MWWLYVVSTASKLAVLDGPDFIPKARYLSLSFYSPLAGVCIDKWGKSSINTDSSVKKTRVCSASSISLPLYFLPLSPFHFFYDTISFHASLLSEMCQATIHNTTQVLCEHYGKLSSSRSTTSMEQQFEEKS